MMGQSARYDRGSRFVEIAKDLIPPSEDIRGQSFRVKSMSFGVGDDGNVRLYALAESLDGEPEMEFPVNDNIYFDPDWYDPFDVASTMFSDMFSDESDKEKALKKAGAILEELNRPAKPLEPEKPERPKSTER